MRIYILACEKTENGGGIYAYGLTEKGTLEKAEYFPCDRPMYAVKYEKGLCILLRKPFEESENSGYFFVDENLKTATKIQNTKGIVACHLCVEKGSVYAVNYLSGNIVKNGEVIVQRQGNGVHPTRQTQPHTHFVAGTPDGYFSVCDLGTDTLAFYDETLNLISEAKVPSGYGIRHLVFSKDGKYIYAVNELMPSVSVFAYENGKAELLQTVTLACKKEKANGAAIRLSEDGEFLYLSLREENVLCVFQADGERLKLIQTENCGGESPRDFQIFGNFLVCTNENSHGVSVFTLENGKIRKRTATEKIPAPLCVL